LRFKADFLASREEMPTTRWEEVEYRARYHFLSLERFDLQNKLNSLEEFLRMQILTDRAQRMRDGDGFQARRRRFLLKLLTYRCIEETRSDLFRKRETVLYPAFDFYPGGSSDPWWEGNEGLFYFRFRFRRQHFLTLMDEMELTGKVLKCGDNKHAHNFPADLCIMVLLNRLSYPTTYKAQVDIFGIPSNRLADIFHAAVDLIYFKYRALTMLETWVPYFSEFAAVFRQYGSPYPYQVALIDGTLTRSARPGGLRNKKPKNKKDQRNFYKGDKGAHGYQTMGAFFPNGRFAMSRLTIPG
jgi:hypothetical protein